MLLLQVKPLALKCSNSPTPQSSPQLHLHCNPAAVSLVTEGMGGCVSCYPGIQGTSPCVQSA